MKKQLLFFSFLLITTGLWGQTNKGAKVVTPSQAIQQNNYNIQVGLPYLGQIQTTNTESRNTFPADMRFPWDILYLYDTFNEESFDVSKGYFGDKILITWTIRNNLNGIDYITIYRREYNDTSNNAWDVIANVASNNTEYEDKYVEGGVLYEYKIEAAGVSQIPELYNTYITGIGYRSPTAIVTGNVNFEAGNPVKDVIVRANSDGSILNIGSALNIPSTGEVKIIAINKPITNQATLQAWMRPEIPFTDDLQPSIRLFEITSGLEKISVEVNLKASSNILEINIGGSIYKLHNYYPSGNLNTRGDDILVPVSEFNINFIHYSIVLSDGNVPILYINGREISQSYRDDIHSKSLEVDSNPNPDYPEPYFEVTIPTETNALRLNNAETKWNSIYLGGGNAIYMDEVRIWNTAKSDTKIRTDYRRYISGNDAGLITYFRANEGVGKFAYDLSRTGFNYNKNHGKLWDNNTPQNNKVLWITGSGNIPSSDQLGILGVTDTNGNYEISSIPYSGTGESYTITPLLGLHQFQPNQKLVFLGEGSSVVNQINFVDKSSFIFKGKVLYDTKNVFNPLNENIQGGASILEEGYNSYSILGVPYIKGHYWLNEGVDPEDKADDFLEEYAQIFVEGANIYVDGNIVLDENSVPVVTGEDGAFSVSVPIGNHYITVKKDGHVFEFDGRFPKASPIPEDHYAEFFENREDQVVFIDKTRVTAVGRVVGGAVEEAKVIGFGENGLFEQPYINEFGNEETVTISSINNIGKANITLGYEVDGVVSDETKYNFITNEESGEYRIELLPLRYSLISSDISIPSSPTISFLKPDEELTIDFSEITELVVPEYEMESDTIFNGTPYNHARSFTYRSTPIINVVRQTSDEEVVVEEEDVNGDIKKVSIPTDGFEFPVYTQFNTYVILMETYEEYINKDDSVNAPENWITDLVPLIDGALEINNQLALADSEVTADFDDTGSKKLYLFRAGLPDDNYPFTNKTIDIQYVLNNQSFRPAEGTYNVDGIILGGVSDGSKTFVTEAPDVPDIILRDPPGSNSFASIEKGTSISISEELKTYSDLSYTKGKSVKTGMLLQVNTAPAGPVTKLQRINDINTGSSYELSSANANSITKKYTFNQTISTSDDPNWVGSDADLYIGKSKNYLYGFYNNIEPQSNIADAIPGTDLILTNSLGTQIFIGSQRAYYFTEDPSDTFFIYSQRFILETLIPELTKIIEDIDSGNIAEGTPGVLAREQYEEQIKQWRRVIQENELSKYTALYDRDNYKSNIEGNLEGQIEEYISIPSELSDIENVFISAGDIIDLVPAFVWPILAKKKDLGTTSGKGLSVLQLIRDIALFLKLKKNAKIDTHNLVKTEGFFKNISIDAGVGEYINSSEIVLVSNKTKKIKLKTSDSFSNEAGGFSNEFGFVKSTGFKKNSEYSLSFGQENSDSSIITYKLKDNDNNNFLSVDVVNSFDGNGPIFSTLGGRTSCPYEGGDTTSFFNNSEYRSVFLQEKSKLELIPQIDFASDIGIAIAVINKFPKLYKALTDELASNAAASNIYSGGEQISYATQQIEVPEISVTVASIIDIPASGTAEFDLILQNNSVVEADTDFLLIVDNTSNPNNALINIEQNGTVIQIPYGPPVKYKMTLKKSISDVYEYNDIRIVLSSLCEKKIVYDDVLVSAHFVPSCTEVAVSAPLTNWVYNIDTAFNLDGTTKPLIVELSEFNTNFNSFEKLEMEYRLATSPLWTKLQTYYATQAAYDLDATTPEAEKSLIVGSTVSFAFDIAGLSLQDGVYEIRAKSSCTNDTEFISEVITGSVDLNAPKRFGTPLPIDGILSAGEDLRVSFNENIFYNSALSKIEILGATNQLPINNNVSLYFEGANNTVTIEKPRIVTGDFSLEFWMNNATVASSATIFSQTDGLKIGLINGQMSATIVGITVLGSIATDNLFHHYTITLKNETGSLSIYQDDTEIGNTIGSPNVQFTNSNSLVIGGNSFIGNIHDLRLWSKYLSLTNAYANIYTKTIGNENGLLGYWPMDEGRGNIANDLAFFKHGIVNASWDIKPKGNSYEFANGQYLELDQVSFAQLTSTMDATISFWIKAATAQEATIFSNGRGDGTDLVQPNGLTNKWAINMSGSGTLSFESEGTSYELISESIADDSWHHVTLLLNRLGSLRTYLDAQQVSSNPMLDIGGLSGNQVWLGARGHKDVVNNETVDRLFTGKLDEFRLWNTLRDVKQIDRDRFNEVDNQNIGLVLYASMNAPEPSTGNGPRYYHAGPGEDKIPDNAILSLGTVNYSDDTPAIKPARDLIKFQINHVINEDDMIIEPVISDWAVLEGQVLDITVHRMFDAANNRQQSPITWTAFVQRNEVSWFADGYNEVVDLVNYKGEDKTFEITVVNGSGVSQPYAITNVPNWMQLSSSSGTLSPDSKKIITVTIDKELAAGIYNEILYLETDFGFNQKLPVNLRVLEKEPNWAVNPNEYAYSTNIVGRIKVDGIFSEDMYDRIGAFYNDEVRGVANLVYEPSYQQYYVYLTIYSNNASGEDIEFRIWDASKGKILQSTIDSNISIPYILNDILGNLVDPAIFENTSAVEQNIAFNKGWTWVSYNVDDVNFNDLNILTNNLVLQTDDRILSYAPSQLETYTNGFGWNGDISNEGGLSVDKMFKVYLANKQSLKIKGTPVDIGVWNFPVTIDWNWLPFTLSSNRLLKEAMSSYQAAAGDVIKSQNLFAIYDQLNGWIGSLYYLEEGKGYMLKSGIDQTFKYPSNFGKSSNAKSETLFKEYSQPVIASNFTKYSNNMNAIVLLPDGYNELLVFDMDKTLKGVSKTNTYNDKELSFITIYGDRNEDLEFYVRNSHEIKPTSKRFIFNKNDILGTFDKPIDLREKNNEIDLYPNPFSNEFSLQFDVDESQTAVVQLYTITGQLIYKQDFKITKGFNIIDVAPKVSNGMYLIYLVTNKNILINKIIKN